MKQQAENLEALRKMVVGAARLEKFSAELNQLINNEKFTVKGDDLLIKKSIEGAGGRQNLIDENTKMEPGLSSISGNRLAKNKGFVVNKVRVSYADALATAIGSADFDTKKVLGGIKNAVMGIRQRGETLMERPVSNFTVDNTSGVAANDKFFTLDEPIFLRDDDTIEWYLIFPNGVSVSATTNDALIEVKLSGASTSRRSA